MPKKRSTRSHSSPGPKLSPRTPTWALATFVALTALYAVWFYGAELTELTFFTDTGEAFHPPRYVLLTYLLEPSLLVMPWFGEPASLALFDRVPILLLATIIAVFAGFVGRLLLQLVHADQGLTLLELVVFSVGVGLNLTGTYVLVLGLLGVLHSNLLVVALAVPAAVSIALGQRIWARRSIPSNQTANQADAGRQQDVKNQNPGLSTKWLWLAAPAGVAIMLGGLLPPVDFDVREYHLNVPKEFFLEGGISFLPHNAYGNMPLGAEMLALLGMLLREDWWTGALVGKTLLAAFAPLTAVMLYAAGVRWYGVTTGVVAAVVYLTTPWVAKVATSGLVEAASAFYLFAAVYAAALWWQTPRSATCYRGRLLLVGFLAGSAVAIKYPAALFVMVPLGLFVAFARGGSEEETTKAGVNAADMLRRVAWFALAASLACGMWFAKNVYFTGNPTYPLLANVFDSATRTPELVERWEMAHDPPNYAFSDLIAHTTDVLGSSSWHTPLIVPLAVLSFLVVRQQGVTRRLWGYVGFVLLAWWVATHRIDRFWVPLLPVMALLAGVGASWANDRRWLRIVATLLACGAVANFLFIPGGPDGYTRYFVPLERLRLDPNRVNPWHAWINANVPKEQGVLLVGDAQAFDIERPTYCNTTFDPSVFEQWVKDRSPEEIRETLAAYDIGFIYVDWGEIERYRAPGNYGFTEFVTPEVFDQLQEQGVLARPWPSIEGHSGQMFPVQKLPADLLDE